MKRQIVYPGAVPLETDLLNTNKSVMTAIGYVLQDMLGTDTLFSGLACTPTAPPGMTVNVAPGVAYSLQATDTGAYSSLTADSHPIMKQGILLDAVNLACPAPTTAGFSINYLIQAAFQEIDNGSTVLPYYNADNPAQAYSGPNGTGTSNTTQRDNTIQVTRKAGAAATTGTQTTPAPDTGFTALYVVTVPFGATTITAGRIVQVSGAPFLGLSLLEQIRQVGIAQFAAVLDEPGYQKLPSGLITQWGQVASSASADTPVTFPLAFPNGILFLSVNPGSTGQGFFGNFNSEGKTGFNLATWSAGSTRAASSVRWFSQGY